MTIEPAVHPHGDLALSALSAAVAIEPSTPDEPIDAMKPDEPCPLTDSTASPTTVAAPTPAAAPAPAPPLFPSRHGLASLHNAPAPVRVACAEDRAPSLIDASDESPFRTTAAAANAAHPVAPLTPAPTPLAPTVLSEPVLPEPLVAVPVAAEPVASATTPATPAPIVRGDVRVIEHPPPRGAKALARQLERERGLGGRLDAELAGVAAVLHDRKVPGARGTVQHIVVSSTGIWIVVEASAAGLVELTTTSRRKSAPQTHLLVGGADKSKLVTSTTWMASAVAASLDLAGMSNVLVRRFLCLPRADWTGDLSGRRLNDCWIVSEPHLLHAIDQPGDLTANAVNDMATHLDEAFPAQR